MLLLLCACDGASTVEVENQLDGLTVVQLWWQTTLFDQPVAPGVTTDALRTVPGDAYAWAVLEDDAANRTAVRSGSKLELAQRGDALHIAVRASTFTDVCSLGAVDRELSGRIFPAAGTAPCP